MNVREITYTFAVVQVFSHHHPFCYVHTPTFSSQLPAPFLLSFMAFLPLHPVSALQHHRQRLEHSGFLYPHTGPMPSPTRTYSTQCVHTRPSTCTWHRLEFYPGDRIEYPGEGPCCPGVQSVWVLLRGNFSKIPFAACWALGATSEVSIGLSCSFPNWVVVMDYIYTSTVSAFYKPSHTSLILEGLSLIFFELGIWDHDYIIFICFSPFTLTPPFFSLPVIII